MFGLSHDSVLYLPRSVTLDVLFPGHTHWPSESVGYVRCASARRASWHAATGRVVPTAAAWRDYPDDVRTHRSDPLVVGAAGQSRLIVGARNCGNEFGHEVRLGGTWIRRACDAPLPKHWPVLQVAENGPVMRSLDEAQSRPGDFVSGLPLVIDGQPVGRDFLLANVSDPAHLWSVHPDGLFGPPPPACEELAEARWVGAAAGLSEAAVAANVCRVASKHGATLSDRLLHSVVAQLADGSLMLLAITGALQRIASLLVTRHQAVNAFVLENSGSVSWACRDPKNDEAVLLGAANQRHAGSVFLRFTLPGFLPTLPHFDLSQDEPK